MGTTVVTMTTTERTNSPAAPPHAHSEPGSTRSTFALDRLPALRSLIEAKGCGLLGHGERVGKLSGAIARKIGLPRTELELLETAAEVHDIGKIGVPTRILNKPGRLTDAEYAVIQQHPEVGSDLLRMLGACDSLIATTLCHHERWDGEGYPFRRRGTEIPIAARILCIADAMDAMASDRPYRASQPRDRILAELEQCAGTQFDPNLVEIVLRLARSVPSRTWIETIAAQSVAA